MIIKKKILKIFLRGGGCSRRMLQYMEFVKVNQDITRFNLKSNCVIRYIDSFSSEYASNVKDIPSSSSIHSNFYQH